jgi:hypothetical protein
MTNKRFNGADILAKVDKAAMELQGKFAQRTRLYAQLVTISKRVAYLQRARNRKENKLYRDIIKRLDKLEAGK